MRKPPIRVTRRVVLRDSAAALLWAATAGVSACGRREEGVAIDAVLPKGPWIDAAAIADAIREPEIPNSDFNITVFGAAPNSDSDARSAIQATIEAAAEAGGGRVVIPEGFWFVDGPLRLRSRIDLHLRAGAHVQFSGNGDRYLPEVLTRFEGTEVWTYSPMIFADGLEHVAITGSGKVDGQGEQNFLPWRKKQKPDQNRLRQMGIDGVPVDERVLGEGHWLRPHFVQFRECRHVLIDGPTFVDSPFWVNHLLYCDQAIVRNIKVISQHINSDGVDVDSSTNVLIENCSFDVGDDGVAIKSGRDQDGWRVNRPSSNIVIRNCEYLGSTGGALAIGSEMSGGVTNVYVDGYKMEKAHHALYFKSNLDRGGMIEHVYIRDVEVGQADSLVIFTNDYHSYRGGNHPTRFENVTIENIHCGKARVGISIIGHPSAPVRDVTVRNTSIDEAETPVQIKYIERLEFDNVTINGVTVNATDESEAVSFDAELVH